jgi:hypothetical protein
VSGFGFGIGAIGFGFRSFGGSVARHAGSAHAAWATSWLSSSFSSSLALASGMRSFGLGLGRASLALPSTHPKGPRGTAPLTNHESSPSRSRSVEGLCCGGDCGGAWGLRGGGCRGRRRARGSRQECAEPARSVTGLLGRLVATLRVHEHDFASAELHQSRIRRECDFFSTFSRATQRWKGQRKQRILGLLNWLWVHRRSPQSSRTGSDPELS